MNDTLSDGDVDKDTDAEVVDNITLVGVEEICVVLLTTVVVREDDPQGMVTFVVTLLQFLPLSYCPSGQPHPSTTGPRQHRSLSSHVLFFA